MSHFSLAIISDGTKPIEEYLAPYAEDCGEESEYAEFFSVDEEYQDAYETESIKKVNVNGEYKDLDDSMFLVPTTEHVYNSNIGNKNINVYCRYEKGQRNYYYANYQSYPVEDVPVKTLYPTFDDYMEKYVGYSKDEKTGKYGYYGNPCAKWDWYVIGGRWKGLLKAKTGEHGEQSPIEPIPDKEGRYDIAQIKDVDFGIDVNSYVRASRFWEVYVEGKPLAADEKQSDFTSFYKPQYYEQRYGTKDCFARSSSELSTFAVITNDGEWHEQGSMGWFGVSDESDEKAQNWHNTWYDVFIKDTNKDWYITIVDCHI